MMIQVDFWALVSLLLGFFGFLFAAGKVLLAQVDRRLEERFDSMEAARAAAAQHWDARLATLMNQMQQEAQGLSALERDFLHFKAELPLQYVRREDYVRGQSVIEAKLDALYNKLEVVQMKGVNHG
ncbi:hypothetical protein R0381_003635 [Jeongeupia wiesaeckerbachi]|uniref:hypothetical protein n=1 Tax=Jeongeupia wiesaeckerbachi TaxID=3051218 RepID=UPI003D809A30